MHIEKDHAISAVAISAGMQNTTNTSTVQDWAHSHGFGVVESYVEIANLAIISATLANEVAACPDFFDDGFPGVYAYEVDEPLGAFALAQIEEYGSTVQSLTDEVIVHELGRLALAYFLKADKPIPHTREIIKAHTDYAEELP